MQLQVFIDFETQTKTKNKQKTKRIEALKLNILQEMSKFLQVLAKDL
jgi:hypothetical protein